MSDSINFNEKWASSFCQRSRLLRYLNSKEWIDIEGSFVDPLGQSLQDALLEQGTQIIMHQIESGSIIKLRMQCRIGGVNGVNAYLVSQIEKDLIDKVKTEVDKRARERGVDTFKIVESSNRMLYAIVAYFCRDDYALGVANEDIKELKSLFEAVELKKIVSKVLPPKNGKTERKLRV